MANHAKLTIATHLPVYFAHPRSPWERPSNENTNELNERPRQTLGFHTPREVFEKLLLSGKVASTG